MRTCPLIIVPIPIILLALVGVLGGCNSAPKTNLAPAIIVAAPVKRTLPALPSKPLTPEMEQMRARAMLVAARLRELDFTNEVGMVELSGWEYGARSSEMAELLGGDDLRALGRLAVAGGMLPEGTDLAMLAAAYTAVSTGANYSPLDKQVILMDKFRGDSLVTHEFVHALQDQHFDLLKLLLVRPFDFDRMEALFAVIEGDAMNVQHRSEEGDAYTRRKLDEINIGGYKTTQAFPSLLTEAFKFRYLDGERFVETVRRGHGERGIDNLFRHPPTSTQQILHPEKYFANTTPPDVSIDERMLNSLGWRLSTSTSMGEIGIRGVLAGYISDRDAPGLAAAWLGDRAFLFERAGSQPLFIWNIAWNTPSAAEEFFRHYGSSLGRPDVRDEEGRIAIIKRNGNRLLILRGPEEDVKEVMGSLNKRDDR